MKRTLANMTIYPQHIARARRIRRIRRIATGEYAPYTRIEHIRIWSALALGLGAGYVSQFIIDEELSAVSAAISYMVYLGALMTFWIQWIDCSDSRRTRRYRRTLENVSVEEFHRLHREAVNKLKQGVIVTDGYIGDVHGIDIKIATDGDGDLAAYTRYWGDFSKPLPSTELTEGWKK